MGQTLHKDDVHESISGKHNAFRKYQDFFVGDRKLWSLVKYEIAHVLASPLPGAMGYVLRKMLMLSLLKAAGDGVQIGRNVTFRHPRKISIGSRTAIDDHCVLDARGIEGDDAFTIGEDVLIARGAALTSKTDRGFIEIGNHCTVAKNCIFSSSGGIRIGEWVGFGGGCYLGGGRYRTDQEDVPTMKQGLYTEGPVVIGDDCLIGAGVHVLDGVTIGRGSIVGAGVVLREDVPEFTVVTPRQRLVQVARGTEQTVEVPHDRNQGQGQQVQKVDGLQVKQRAVRDSVYRAIDVLNQTLPAEKRIKKVPETPLKTMDSLDKVNLIVETEMAIEEDSGHSIDLADQDAVTQGANLFETVASFSAYVESQLERQL